MVLPVGLGRLLARQDGEFAAEEVAERQAGGVDVAAVAVDEVHRHIEHVVGVALVAEAVLEDEGQHAGALRVGVRPDVAAIGEHAVGLALGKGRVGEERGGERLQRQADAELLRHVRLARIVEVDLDGAGPEHHVEAHRADARHVAAHDVVAALGHDRQLGAGLVGPHAEAEEADAEALARLLDLGEVAAGLGAGLVQGLERRAREFELAGGLQADAAVVAGKRDDVGAVGGGLLDRAPAVARQVGEQVADAAGLVVGRGVVVTPRVDELLVLGADPPALGRLLAAREAGDQLVARFDDRRGLAGRCRRVGLASHARALRGGAGAG